MEKKRDCGYRKIGGLYLVGGGPARPCDFLPYELTVCAHCGAGVKPARGFTWLTRSFFGPVACKETCRMGDPVNYIRPRDSCPFDELPDAKFGLLWIGEMYYPTPESFLAEARAMGISRRIAQIPRELALGSTWVFFAHRRVPMIVPHRERVAFTGDHVFAPGIFYMFRPSAIEKILTKELATPEELASCEKRGISPVIVDDCAQHRTGEDPEPESYLLPPFKAGWPPKR